MPESDESNSHNQPLASSRNPAAAALIFGGSFDPVHCGHIAALRAALDFTRIPRGILLPAFVSPHKLMHAPAAAADRLKMLQLALENHPQLSICEDELAAARAVYTYDSLDQLRQRHREVNYTLLIGTDQLMALHRWHRAADLVNEFPLCVLPRAHPPDFALLSKQWGPKIAEQLRAAVLPIPTFPQSSSAIRTLVASGQSLSGLVPATVEAYIRKHRLYQTR